MSEIRNTHFCPHCGNTSPQRLVHHQVGSTTLFWSDDPKGEQPEAIHFFVAFCEVCHCVLVYQALESVGLPDTDYFAHGELVYPPSGEFGDGVPDTVRTIYAEALRIKLIAPSAFAAQIRRALEALCADRGESHGSLDNRIKRLADKGEIPATLAKMSNSLRLLGNLGAHADPISVEKRQVFAIGEFFRAIVEYVYNAPYALAVFQLNEANRGVLSKNDDHDPGDEEPF